MNLRTSSSFILMVLVLACGRDQGVSVTADAASTGGADPSAPDSVQSTDFAADAAGMSLEHLPATFRRMANDKSRPIIAAANPVTAHHCVFGNHVVLGLSNSGGGYVSFAHHAKNIRNKIDCADVTAGRVKNEAAAGFGRGWQSALRDRLHSGRYNPTQAGFLDGAGRPVTGGNRESRKYAGIGSVSRFSYPAFNAALFSDPIYDFTQFEDLYADYRDEGTAAVRDRDGIAAPKNGGRDGGNQDAEVRSEFDFTGAIEVWSDVVGVGDVDVFRQVHAYSYERAPRAILQFGKSARKDDGSKIIDEADRLPTLSDVLKAGKPEDTDLSAGILEYGIRLAESAGFDKIVSWKPDGRLSVRPLRKELYAEHVKGGGDGDKDPKLHAGIVGGKKLPLSNHAVLMVCKCDNQGNGRAWAIYAAPASVNNSKQVIGRGGKSYKEDRRFQTVLKAAAGGEGGGTKNINGGIIEENLTKLSVGTFFKGLYAPGRTAGDTRESVRQEVFILHGSPKEIVKAVSKLEALTGAK